jgi:serine/threonine protein kinase
MDPFIVECRVYDFLIEHKLVGVVGPNCHGWLTISKDQELKLARKLRPAPDWRRRSDTADDPVRGLLLEYVEGCSLAEASITALEAQSLRDQLNHLHSLDIAHGDLVSRNIMVSNQGRAFLIDFSSAKLWPHSDFRLRKREDFLRRTEGEKSLLELFFFRLQNVRFCPIIAPLIANVYQLERHQNITLTKAQSEEEAYGRPIDTWANVNYQFSD